MHALSSQMLRSPASWRIDHAFSASYFSTPSSCQLCDRNAAHSPRAARFVRAYAPVSLLDVRSDISSWSVVSTRNLLVARESVSAGERPPTKAAMAAASCSDVPFAPSEPRKRRMRPRFAGLKVTPARAKLTAEMIKPPVPAASCPKSSASVAQTTYAIGGTAVAMSKHRSVSHIRFSAARGVIRWDSQQ